MIRYVTVAEIIATYRRPRSTIYRLAHTDKWRRVTDGKREALYHAEDVAETFARLAANRRNLTSTG